MADLDPALVEKVARAICLEDGQDPDAMDAAIVCDIDSNPLPTWQAYEDKSRAALLSLPIPVSALNALARGEATVVPLIPDSKMEEAASVVWVRLFSEHDAWWSIETRLYNSTKEVHKAICAASPYAAPLPAPSESDHDGSR